MILDKLTERRATLRNPTPALWEALTGGTERTTSGEHVNPRSAMSVAAYFAAIRAIAEDVAKLPCPVYRELPRGREKLAQHPVSQLLNVEPNDEMGAMAFRATMLSHAMGYGGGFAAIQFNGDNLTPYALWPIDPTTVSLHRSGDGTLVYRVYDGGQGPLYLDARQVFHLHGLGSNGLTGYSIAEQARETLGLAKAQEKSGAALFGSGSRPGGVLTTPMKLKPEVRKELRQQWDTLFAGASNTAKTAILHAGFTWTPVASPNKDAQWLEARQFSVEEIARWFRMPPHKLQDLTHGTYSNIEHENISYVVDTLTSWATYFEQEVARRLLTKRERAAGLYVRHNFNALLRGATAERFDAHQKSIYAGWRSRNEVRELEEMNPMPDDQGGDEFLVPVNMMLAKLVGQPMTSTDVQTELNDTDRRLSWLKPPTRLAA